MGDKKLLIAALLIALSAAALATDADHRELQDMLRNDKGLWEMAHKVGEERFELWYSRANRLHELLEEEWPLSAPEPPLSPPVLRRVQNDEEDVYYVHLPKCGGSGVPEVVWKGVPATLRVWDGSSPQGMVMAVGHMFRDHVHVLYGHMPYGLHLLDAEAPGYHRRANYMTMLRHPIERVVSHYFYHRARKGDPGHALAISNTLEEWLVKSPSGQNAMTQFLAGTPDGVVTEDMARVAKLNLLNCSWVGLLEEYDKSMEMLKYQTRRPLGRMYRVHANANKQRPSLREIPMSTLSLIQEQNRYDVELYALARQIFDARWKQYLKETV